MASVSAAAGERAMALTGSVDGNQRLYVLSPGPNTVGRSSDNDIVLVSSGVSGRHAVIEVENQIVEIRDLKSKNGTLVGGKRVDKERVSLGQRIRFGPVALRLEEVSLEDTWLSVRATSVSPGPRRGFSQTSTFVSDSEGISPALQRWLNVMEAITIKLGTDLKAVRRSALGAIVNGIGASGAALIEISAKGSPIILASAGELTSEIPLQSVRRVQAKAARSGEDEFESSGGNASHWTIVMGPSGRALIIEGAGPFGAMAPKFLRFIYRMIAPTAVRREDLGDSSREQRLQFPDTYVLGESRAMQDVYREIASVADSDIPVLLIGETGVGKELLAKTVHLSSRRSDRPFSPINCAAIPADLLEAELFGISKGVATGVAARRGKFALANGGTIFLDEIGDMSAALQAKLLRALEERLVRPVGGEPVEVDVRLIAATNTELTRKVESGEFREDLYYRLAGLVIEVPPLRRRSGDIGALVEHFFHRASGESRGYVAGITYGAMRELKERRWPGNVRELQHAVRRLVFQCPEAGAIDSAMVRSLRAGPSSSVTDAYKGCLPDFSNWEDLNLEDACRGLITEAMMRREGNQTAAAALLGITRSSLRRRLAKLFPEGIAGSEAAGGKGSTD